jgi:hypothetical protein
MNFLRLLRSLVFSAVMLSAAVMFCYSIWRHLKP